MKYCKIAVWPLLVLILTGCEYSDVVEDNPASYVQLGQYKGLEVELNDHEVTDEELEEEFNLLASNYSTTQIVEEGVVASGDVVNIDYEGKKDGVAFAGGTAQGTDLTIGSGTFIPGFEEGLIGVNVGDTVDLNLTFPEEYQSTELAGQDVVFTVKVNHIAKEILPEITDDFIKEISGGEFATVEEYSKKLEEQIISEYAEFQKLQMYEDLWNMAVDNATLVKEFPEEIRQEKISRMLINVQKYAASAGMSVDDFIQQQMGITREEYNKQAVEYAQVAVKESAVLAAICEKEGITLSDEEFEAAIDKYVKDYGYSSREDFTETQDMNEFREYILTSMVQDFLAENAVIKNKQDKEINK